MNKINVKHIIIISCSILLVFSLLLALYFSVKKNKDDDFYSKLSQIDYNISNGFYVQASEDLRNLYNEINSSKSAIMFLKRCNKISELKKDYSMLADYTYKMKRAYKNNIEIAAIASYADQKNGNFIKSLETSGSKLSRSEYYEIHLLNVLKTGRSVEDFKIKEKMSDSFSFIFSDNEIHPDNLIAASNENYDSRYILDSVLLYAENGELSDAYSLIKKTSEEEYNEVKMNLAYDTHDYKAAEKYFYKLFKDVENYDNSVYFTGCDILLKNNKDNEAASLYEQFIIENPDDYSLPYRNLYAINRDNSNSLKWLSEGLKLFPESRELLVSSAWEFYLENNIDNLKETLEYLEKYKNDPVTELFKINMMLGSRSPEHIIGNFWNVFNSNPRSDVTATAFSNYLLQNKQIEQLFLLLEKYRRAGGNGSFASGYEAIGAAMTGKYDQSLELISIATENQEDTVNLFNMGIILSLKGLSSKANQFFQKALIIEEGKSNNEEILSKIYLKLSETNYNDKNYSDAYFYIKKSIDLHPDNMKSRLLLKKIEEDRND